LVRERKRNRGRIEFVITAVVRRRWWVVAVGSCHHVDGRLIAGDVAVVVASRTYLARRDHARMIVDAHRYALGG
jgi:hypothetical protein